MKKFKVHFNEAGAQYHKRWEDVIYGYSEEDALLRSNIKQSHVKTIFESFI